MFVHILSFIGGTVIGAGVMWYYWRRYKTTEAFKDEIGDRANQLKDLADKLAQKSDTSATDQKK